MSLIVSAKGGKDFAIHPAGVVAARCTRIIDLGTQDGEWKGKAKQSHKIMFTWESELKMPEDQGDMAGKPFLITSRYTASLTEKAGLRKALESWRGRKFTPQELDAFDLKNVLGKACMLNMVHSDADSTGKVYSNIASIMPLPASMTAPQASGQLVFFSLSDFDRDVFDSLSDGLKDVIAKSPEYQHITLGSKGSAPAPASPPVDDDDIPF